MRRASSRISKPIANTSPRGLQRAMRPFTPLNAWQAGFATTAMLQRAERGFISSCGGAANPVDRMLERLGSPTWCMASFAPRTWAIRSTVPALA